MIESKRADKKKNQAKVIKALVKDPWLTERELAKETWLSNWSAHNHKEELEQNWATSSILDRVLKMDDEILDLVNWLHLRDIRKKVKDESELSLQDHKLLWDLANNSTKRKAIFWSKEWKPVWEVIIQL